MCATVVTEPAATSWSFLSNHDRCRGTPKQTAKKTVRFADTLGLPLVQTKEYDEEDDLSVLFKKQQFSTREQPTLEICFAQVGRSPTQLIHVIMSHILVELVTTQHNQVHGTILVHNICFQKEVFVRYTTDSWLSSRDVPCFYDASVSTLVDRFKFTLTFTHLAVGRELEFCVAFRAGETEFWDSNFSRNYKVRCVAGDLAEGELYISKSREANCRGVVPYW